MFAEETEKLVNELIQAEYKNACEQFGDKYNSLHEGYAVLLEEVEEVEVEFEFIESTLKGIWKETKTFSLKNYSEKILLGYCKNEMEYVKRTMKELAQVGAVLQKIKNTLGKDINVVTNDEVEE